MTAAPDATTAATERIGELLAEFRLPTLAAEFVARVVAAGRADMLPLLAEIFELDIASSTAERMAAILRCSARDGTATSKLPKRLTPRCAIEVVCVAISEKSPRCWKKRNSWSEKWRSRASWFARNRMREFWKAQAGGAPKYIAARPTSPRLCPSFRSTSPTWRRYRWNSASVNGIRSTSVSSMWLS